MTSIFTGAVNPAGVYYIILHYRRTHSLSKKVEHISIANQIKSNISVTFRYCPASGGCRVVIGEEDSRSFQFRKGILTATIQHERRTHLVSRENVLLLFVLLLKIGYSNKLWLRDYFGANVIQSKNI